MAYDLETKEKARMMWLKGISFETIAEELAINMNTVFNWSVADNWKDDVKEIKKKVKEKSNDKLADDIDKMNQMHLAQLAASHTLIRDARVRVENLLQTNLETITVEDEKLIQRPMKSSEIRSLTSAVRDLASAIDITLKGERLIRNIVTEKKEISANITWEDIIYESEKILNE